MAEVRLHDIKNKISPNEVFDNILDRIIKLELEPGQMISENVMAGEYGISRTGIRNVFSRLNEIGFIEVYPQRGSFVTLFDTEYLRRLLRLRIAAEREILYEIIFGGQAKEKERIIEELEANIEEQKKYTDEKDFKGVYAKLDMKFHKILIESAKWGDFYTLLDSKMLHIERWKNFDQAKKRIPKLIEQHTELLSALKEDDYLKAAKVISNHLNTIPDEKFIMEMKEQKPEYFVK